MTALVSCSQRGGGAGEGLAGGAQVSALALSLEGLLARVGAFTLGPLDLQVARGEHVLLRGPSGAGKSALLAALMGWLPHAGGLWLRGVSARGLSVQARRLGWVAQAPLLFPHLTVAQNVGYGVPVHARAAQVARWAECLELQPLLQRWPGSLSGGEAQRVALARALAPAPDIVLLDEPFSALDPARRAAGWAMLQALQAQGVTLLHVTHDEALVADRQVHLLAGRLRSAGRFGCVSCAPQLR